LRATVATEAAIPGWPSLRSWRRVGEPIASSEARSRAGADTLPLVRALVAAAPGPAPTLPLQAPGTALIARMFPNASAAHFRAAKEAAAPPDREAPASAVPVRAARTLDSGGTALRAGPAHAFTAARMLGRPGQIAPLQRISRAGVVWPEPWLAPAGIWAAALP